MTKCKTIPSDFGRIPVTPEFVEQNKLSLNRTPEEIIKHIQDANDMFGFQSEVLVAYLTFEQAKPLLKPDAQASNWGATITDVKEAAQDFLDYMTFAWMKAKDRRGISASRSIEKLAAWLWLMGREDLEELILRDELYNPYGAPALIAVCEKMRVAVPKEVIKFASLKCT